jgi:hypothetical protein
MEKSSDEFVSLFPQEGGFAQLAFNRRKALNALNLVLYLRNVD